MTFDKFVVYCGMINLSHCVYLLLVARVNNKREYQTQWAKKWRAKNPGIVAKRRKEWVEKNPEKYIAGYRSSKNKKKQCERSKAYRLAHPETVRKANLAAKRRRYIRDPLYRAVMSMRCRIRHALAGTSKSAKTFELLSCDATHLKRHLEKQFLPGMTWENYGVEGWHIDHIRPCASFDLTNPAQQRECFHYTNLQPLWAIDNIKKGDR